MSELQIIEGRKYVTRGGYVAGPMKLDLSDERYPFNAELNGVARRWGRNGVWLNTIVDEKDLVAEWSEPTTQEAGPVTKDALRTPRMIIEWLPDGTVYIRSYGTSGADDLRETALALLDRANELEQDAPK